MNAFRTLLLFLVFHSLQPIVSYSQKSDSACIFKPEDKQIIEQKLETFRSRSDLPIGELIVEVGLSFQDKPYVVASLENGPLERLVVNLREFDCTTFAETCLALARTVKLGKTDFKTFVNELTQIRYRKGIRQGYASRLHYFSEWISDNEQKGLVSSQPNKAGVRLEKVINFMSTHPGSYPVLKSNPEFIPEIARVEAGLTQSGFWYFPKSMQNELLNAVRHGDIIALTSDIKGIDMNHVGIAVEQNGKIRLLHASQSSQKVSLSEGPITDFIQAESKNSGIAIARPLF